MYDIILLSSGGRCCHYECIDTSLMVLRTSYYFNLVLILFMYSKEHNGFADNYTYWALKCKHVINSNI